MSFGRDDHVLCLANYLVLTAHVTSLSRPCSSFCSEQVREAMADKAGVLTSEEVEEMEAQLRVRVGEQRNRTFERIAMQHAEWEREQLATTAVPQLTHPNPGREK